MNNEPVLEGCRSRAIVVEQGGNLALAASELSKDMIAETMIALGQSIIDTLLEALDRLVVEPDHRYEFELQTSRSISGSVPRC